MRPNLVSLADAELVALAQRGSVEAFAAIYDRHAPHVARSLASFAGPDATVLDDLVQEVFLRVIQNIASYQPTHPFLHWLSTVTLNTGRNHVRTQRVVSMDPTDMERVAGGYEPDAALVTTDLLRLTSTLPITLREVVALRVGWDLPYAEVGEVLGIPEGTARRRMHEAITTLRERVATMSRKRSAGHE